MKLTSALNSVNSSPRQSNSMMVWGFGGEAWVYAIGAALMVAVDSRWEGLGYSFVHSRTIFDNYGICSFLLSFVTPDRRIEKNEYSYFTSSTFPHEIRFASASTHVAGFLFGISNISRV